MSVALDILRTWRAPRAVQAKRLAGGAREDRALAILMSAAVVGFVAQWPRLAREAFFDPSIGFDARFAGALFAWLMIVPLLCYAAAFAIHLVLRLSGSRATGFEVRMTLFWAALATGPALLLAGLVAGFIGPGPAATAVGVVTLAAFFLFWEAGLRVILRPQTEVRP